MTLSEVGGSKVWQANSDLSESTDPDRPAHFYSTYNSYYGYHNLQGVTVEFAPADLSDRTATSADLPLTLQFDVPVSAGMSNPRRSGDYRWVIVLFHDFANSCEAKSTWVISSIPILPPYLPGEVQFFPKNGSLGTRITFMGDGFQPNAPVQVVRVGPFIMDPNSDPWVSIAPPEVTTDDSGAFELKIILPGMNLGPIPIEVGVDGKTVSAEFTVTESGISGPDCSPAKEGLANLGDNSVRSFHYDEFGRRWTFYDPEFPDESDQHYFIYGERYWILVKEPVEVILNSTTRNLTCSPEGNCWNQIVW